ncbi:hypothetical protein Kisp01_63570 [Kineosporia sp. NBRC 101677]|nr:hypothetical protein Kisp01_63570 [Kineosporia sp. NBRC 101677]
MTRRPAKSDRETSDSSAAVRVKGGAVSPTSSLVTFTPLRRSPNPTGRPVAGSMTSPGAQRAFRTTPGTP